MPNLPRLKEISSGFTLIELLVVVAIIAILAVVSLALFGNVQKAARDGVRRSNIDTLAKNLETRFDYGSSLYQQLDPNDFSEGLIPKDPDGSSYNGVPQSATSSFQLCAALDNHPLRSCNSPSQTCFCKSSMRGDLTAIGVYNGTYHPPSCDPNGTLDDGLVGYWKMDETTNWNSTPGEVRDSSGNGNNGTAYGGANITQHTPDPTGVFKNAGNFDGSNDYISTVSNALFTNEFTISGWFYVSSWKNTGLPAQDMELILSKWRREVGDIDYGVYFGRSYGGANFVIWVSSGVDTSGNSAQVPIGSVSAGVWHYVAATFKGSSFLRLYLDGGNPANEQTSGVYSSVSNPLGVVPLVIGIHNDGYGLFAGKIDDLRVYNRALSGPEISNLYNGGNGCIP